MGIIGGFLGWSAVLQYMYGHYLIKTHIFGFDGNGGMMLKIITALTDEEMARLKYAPDYIGTGRAPASTLTVERLSLTRKWQTVASILPQSHTSSMLSVPHTTSISDQLSLVAP